MERIKPVVKNGVLSCGTHKGDKVTLRLAGVLAAYQMTTGQFNGFCQVTMTNGPVWFVDVPLDELTTMLQGRGGTGE